ncbi:Putative Osmotin/thaumatin-like superfamily [Septoria linicola]|uniref:Osmotin/thaumatin-like superfamily n=1 Tax=Septoria linicola TaxID=215465 RepID=A0A9Q9AIV6_9PEZI|nr:putative Osmotin/thaumatin-like superfamily [Septoria linicola]USW47753.1 Putative Osmotin/thaumatin-like superfamily [Septoria linicola]
MMNTAVASFALFAASAVAGSYGYSATGVGSAHVVNKCNYPVKLCNVPSSGGGYEEEDKILAAGESWSQPWTSLSNGNGWSIKLSKTDNLDHILQYEYTYHNDGIIWYDLSCVDGNPWDKDWEITANGTDCNPKQQAYRYSTDDAYGMQSCSQDTAITVTLCTGVSADNGSAVDGPSSDSSDSAPSSSASAPSYTSAASAPSYEDKSSKATSAPAATAYGYNWNNADAAKSAAAKMTPTTFATAVTAAVSTDDAQGVTVTEIETIYATAEVTAYANRHRRHEHVHAGHNHA